MRLKKMLERTDIFSSRYYNQQISRKYLFGLDDGSAIETTAFLHSLNDVNTDLSIDITTMVGCPMRCRFCAATSMRYERILNHDEIIQQVIRVISDYSDADIPQIVCSFQGIGEPCLIPDLITQCSKTLLNIDQRIVVSLATTAYNTEAIHKWIDSGIRYHNVQFSITGSLDENNRKLMPDAPSLEAIIPLAQLMIESNSAEKVKFNYILLKEINDSDFHLQKLISAFKHTGLTVKISALNYTEAAKRYKLVQADINRAQEFQRELAANGIDSYVFGAFSDMNMSCGQLAFLDRKKK
jgi:23S rRNA (adenine2503-C2)-methyltransferase